ncbi:MAG: hypothetical protein QOD30_843 [Actinomycetota bacterium]|jgi:SAM-dependent methyltransferase|nr:hypothetical protein [Actinomycetota bacterium]
MKPDGPDDHPLMAVLYDLENQWGDADDFFLAVANRRPASGIADLGCGTGTVTIALARAGHVVTGVEPNRSFFGAAGSKEGGELVEWVHGTSRALRDAAYDLVLMTGHVVQAFIGDDEWMELLADVRRSLRPGGLVAFDALDPEARAWERWIGGWSGTLPGHGPFTSGATVTSVVGDVVTFEVDTTLPGGERRFGASEYRFRSAGALRTSLADAGFRVDELYGGWHDEPVGHGVGEIVVVASASSEAPAERR